VPAPPATDGLVGDDDDDGGAATAAAEGKDDDDDGDALARPAIYRRLSAVIIK